MASVSDSDNNTAARSPITFSTQARGGAGKLIRPDGCNALAAMLMCSCVQYIQVGC
jgi:hypothetical protein